MKRPIIAITLGYIIGIIWGVYVKQTILPIIILYPIYLIINKKTKNIYFKFYLKKSIILILIITSIISNTITLINNKKYETLYFGLEEIKVKGIIINNGIEKNNKIIYKIKVKEIEGVGVGPRTTRKYKNTNLYLNINKKQKIKLNYGDLIQVEGTYKKTETQKNYKGFNYKEYLKTLKIYGTISTKNKIEIIKKEKINKLFLYSNKLNLKIQKNIKNILPEKQADLLIGIILGNKNNIDEEIINNFKTSNISHLLAVSGAHITYLIIGITFVLEKIKTHKKYRKIITILFLIIFMFLTNFQISVVRASISAIIILFSSLIYKQYDTYNSVAISLLIILLNNPFSINSLSLQLSFGGTIGIILFYKLLYKETENKIINKIKSIILISVSAQIIIFPIMLKNFGTISLTFFISNLFVSYIFAIIIILGLIIILISLINLEIANLISIILNLFLKILIFISDVCAKIPLSKIYFLIPNIKELLIYYLIIFLILFYKNLSEIRKKKIKNTIIKNKQKIIAINLIIILIFPFIKINPKNLKIYFIDVGQGDSCLIQTPRRKKYFN